MSVPGPIMNFRASQPVKDAMHLLASRKGAETGPTMRLFIIERIVVEAALDCLRVWGFEETLRRLSQPSPVLTQDPTRTQTDAAEQTSENLVLQNQPEVKLSKTR